MRRGIIYQVIENRRITLFLLIIMVGFGLYSYYFIPKQENPTIEIPAAIITTIYPGASPEDVEKLVTSKIEDELTEITGYDYTMSTSANSLSSVILVLNYGTDVDKAWSEIRRKMQDLQSQLPKECLTIHVDTELMNTVGFILSVSGENYTYDELKSYAENYKKSLSKIEGISKVDINGDQEKEIIVDVDYEKLNQLNVSLDDIVNLIGIQNLEVPSGKLESEESKINLYAKGRLMSAGDVKDLIIGISSKSGAALRLGDIAEIGNEIKSSNKRIKFNGKNALLITGYFEKNKNVVHVGHKVEENLNKLRNDLPDDISVEKVIFQPEDIEKSVNNFTVNLLESVVFVVLVVFIGMGFRNAIIVSIAIPVSIIMTFTFMNIVGIDLHQISITALIVALGMLVDNAIVVSDAIQIRIDRDEDRIDACLDGVKEVAVPILTSTLTTIAAFLPLLFIFTFTGDYIRSLPQIIIISLLSSYFTALFITPTMAYMFFQKSKKGSNNGRIKELFSIALTKGMQNKAAAFIILFVAILGCGVIAKILNLQFFPKEDKNLIYINATTEKNIDLDHTEDFVEKIMQELEQEKEIISYTTSIGGGLPKFNDTIPITIDAADTAQILIRLDLKKTKRFRKNTEFANYLQQRLDSKITGGDIQVKEIEKGEPVGAPISLRLLGDNMESLVSHRDNVKSLLSDTEGTTNIKDDLVDKKYEFVLTLDKNKAYYHGVSEYDIQNEVSIALTGREASIIRKSGKEVDIVVKSNIKTKEEIENLKIKSSITGKKVFLKDIADIKLISSMPIINKYEGKYSITITSDVKSGYNAVAVQRKFAKEIERLDFPGIEVELEGEDKRINKSFGDITSSAIFAIMAVYIILMFQFRSFIQPVVILLTVPLSSIGSIIGLFIFRQPLSFTALLGIVSLIGIVVNNAIVLIDFINIQRRNGSDVNTACIEATDKRFRPIILSTTTTVIGLTPLVLSGSELFTPMSVALMAGLMISTLLTLVIIPIGYIVAEENLKRIFVTFVETSKPSI